MKRWFLLALQNAFNSDASLSDNLIPLTLHLHHWQIYAVRIIWLVYKGGRILQVAFMLLGGAGLWILFVGDIKPEEMIVGCICLLLSVAFTAYLEHHLPIEIRFRMEDVVQMWRIPGYLITGTWEIVCVLVVDVLHIHAADSLFRAVPFENGNGPVAAGRRVLAVTYTTATPNSIVVGVDCEENLLLMHQLKRTGIHTMTRRLGAKA